MTIYVICVLFFGFSSLLLGFLIYLRRRDALGKHWLIYSIVCGLWGIGYSYQINNAENYETALWISRIGDTAAIFIPVAWLRFIYEYLGLKVSRKLFASIYVFAFLLLLSAPTPWFVEKMVAKPSIGLRHFVQGGPFFHLFAAYFFIITIFAFITMLRCYYAKDRPTIFKKQTSYLILASGIGFAGGSTALLPCYDFNFPVYYGTLLLPFFPLIMAFAISCHRFLEVDQIAQAAHYDKLAAIGILTASMNHEIRNPLYVVKGLAETLLGRYEDPRSVDAEGVKTALAKIIAQSERAMDTVKRFSLFAKQKCDQALHPEPLRLEVVLDEVLPLVASELAMDQVRFVRDIPQDLDRLLTDRRLMEEIFFNLIVNACQAMKLTGGEIRISAMNTKTGVKIEIADTGPGMTEETKQTIFQPFYTTREQGTGLGLYITKQLVEKNRGKITVQSEEGKGTTFVLEFKAA